MLKTIVIAVCCAVAYLAIVIGLTVYCSIRLMRAKNLRKVNRPTELLAAGAGACCNWDLKVKIWALTVVLPT